MGRHYHYLSVCMHCMRYAFSVVLIFVLSLVCVLLLNIRFVYMRVLAAREVK